MVTRVGYIGVGGIGAPIAENVVKGGFELMVYDLREEAMEALAAQGARMARSSPPEGITDRSKPARG